MADLYRIRLPFQEQIEFFRQKLNLPTEAWDDILHAAHDRAFVVAGAMNADLLDDLRKAVDAAIAGGDTIADFRKKFKAIVEKHGWHGWTGEGSKAGEAWRQRVIYTTNIASSYAAGRWQQLTDPDLLKLRPYWRYVHNDSVLSPRPHHKAWGDAGLTLRHDHPFWQTHFPPNGWGCRCRVTAVKGPQEGDATEPPEGWNTPDAKGNLPGIDKGWAYAPGASVADELRQFATAKAAKLPPELARDFAASVAGMGKAMDNGGMRKNFDFTGQRQGLKNLPPIVVTELSGKEFGSGLSHKQLTQAANEMLRGLQRGQGLPNDDTGWLFQINKKGRKKIGDNEVQSIAELQAVSGIAQLARNAVVAESHPDIEHHNEFVKAVYRLYAPLVINGVLYRVKLTVKDYAAIGNKKMLHALAAVEIENAPLGTLPTSSDESSVQSGQPTTGRLINIADLLKDAIMNDGKPYEL